MSMENGTPVLEVEDLTLRYQTRQGEVQAVEGVSFQLAQGQSLGLVGESGCGKTSVANCLMRLLPENAHLAGGQVKLSGTDLTELGEEEMRSYRWRRIAMVFQAAMNSLDPVHRVGQQIIEAIEAHGMESTVADARERVARLFRMVGLDPQLMDRYPHEFSGGMRQRAVIAMALSCDPDLIIADEPTTALDVIVQDRILRELKIVQQELRMAMIYISHDIGVVAEVTDRIGVMYAGRLVELGDTAEVFRSPMHPYTAALMSSFPSVHGERLPLVGLAGEPPNLIDPPAGCPFHPRCQYADEICRTEFPTRASRGDHWAACWHPLDGDPVSENRQNQDSQDYGIGRIGGP
ncbi:MAG: ABC transporter ATP-binding protein [Chloroflexota bacterium]|nr:ABC transporter ATP-binding protein [Chloroflexota bacterium]MDE2958743.1 ABC transporter ATP-binding protein [Chloroflexota bacterium]